MKMDASIFIKSLTVSEVESVPIELYTKGNYYRKNNSYYISYAEKNENGEELGNAVIKVSDDNVVSVMKPSNGTSMVMESGKHNECRYDTQNGELIFGIETDYIVNKLNDDGGTVDMKYRIEVNSILLNEVTLSISVKTLSKGI